MEQLSKFTLIEENPLSITTDEYRGRLLLTDKTASFIEQWQVNQSKQNLEM